MGVRVVTIVDETTKMAARAISISMPIKLVAVLHHPTAEGQSNQTVLIPFALMYQLCQRYWIERKDGGETSAIGISQGHIRRH
jgi:hypothetical protein